MAKIEKWYSRREIVVTLHESGNPLLVIHDPHDPDAEPQRFRLTPDAAMLAARQLAFAASASHGQMSETAALEVRLTDDTLLRLAELLKAPE